MKKNNNIRIIFAYGIILLLAAYFLPKEVDWTSSFSSQHSQPYGCKVLRNEMPAIFDGSLVTDNTLSIYQVRDSIATQGSNLIIIDESLQMDSLDVSVMLNFISDGNTALLSAYSFPQHLRDSLDFEVDMNFLVNDIIREGFRGTNLEHNFFNTDSSIDSTYKMEMNGAYHYFVTSDTTDHLGGLGWVKSKNEVNFMYLNIGEGRLFLHSNPYVFTNYNILDSVGSKYVSHVLSFLPKGDITWDEYYKEIYRKQKGKPLQVILAETPLRWALYLSLLGILLALLFLSKRRQRIIPELDPYSNDSKDLVETIGNLYYNTSDNNTIATKKLVLLRQELFRRYKSSDLKPSKENIEFLKDKTGINGDEIHEILLSIKDIENASQISDTGLDSFNKKINKLLFKR